MEIEPPLQIARDFGPGLDVIVLFRRVATQIEEDMNNVLEEMGY